jgi:aminopeptidase N
MLTSTPKTIFLKDYTPPAFLVTSVDLDVDLRDDHALVTAKLVLARNPKAAEPRAPLVLDADELELVSVAVEGKVLRSGDYVLSAERLEIPGVPDRFTLESTVRIRPKQNTKLMGLYASKDGYFTQCEAEGFRRITYFPDRPDVMAVYTTRIEAEKADAPVLLANGNLVASGDVPGTTRHFAVWHDPFPKPSYLFALVGGKLACVEDRFRTMSGREVTLRIYVEPGKESRCAYAMDSLKRAMRWDETAFGREYDLDIFMIVAVSDFNMGAMENKGLHVFNDKYVLASPETATDTDF